MTRQEQHTHLLETLNVHNEHEGLIPDYFMNEVTLEQHDGVTTFHYDVLQDFLFNEA